MNAPGKKKSHRVISFQNKSHKEKKEIGKQVLIVPQEITSKRGLMLWLLENLGKQWIRISCAMALEKLGIDDNKKNRKQWYNIKSEFKRYLRKSEGASKYQKPQISYHNFNQSSVFLSSAFTMRVRDQVLEKGWELEKSKNRSIIWKSKSGWIRWYETGRCRLHCRKPVHDAKILQLLADAFFNTNILKDIREFTSFYRSFFMKSVKVVAHLGKDTRIPRFRLEFDNGINKLIVMNDVSHPHDIEIQYFLLKDGEQFRQYLKDSQRSMDYATETNIQLLELLKQLTSPKPLTPDKSRMVA